MTFLKHIKPSIRNIEAYSVKGKPLSPDLIKLNQNENPFDLPEDFKNELLNEFFQFHWNRYPDVLPVQLIQKLSRWLKYPQEGILAANGSNELMYTALMAIVGKGTNVVIPSPTFFLYEKIVRVLDGNVVSVPMKKDLSFDIDAVIAETITAKASLVILNSPNSPTGQSISINDVERVLTETGAMVIVDEAYIEFSDKPSAFELVKRYDTLIILRTFSKAFSLAGLRIGYLIAQPAVCAEIVKPKIPFSVNNLSQHVAMKLLDRIDLVRQRVDEIKKQKEILYTNMLQIDKISVFPSDTNFLIFTTAKDAQALFESLLSENVLIRDVSSYPLLNNTLRVNAGTEGENAVFLSALKKYI